MVRFGSDLQNTCKGYYLSKWVLSHKQVKAATISSSVQYILLSFFTQCVLHVCYALDARRETQAGSPQDHMATDSWEGNKGDGEDLGGHQVHGKGSPDVEGTRCCPTCLLGVKSMNEWMKCATCMMVHMYQKTSMHTWDAR